MGHGSSVEDPPQQPFGVSCEVTAHQASGLAQTVKAWQWQWGPVLRLAEPAFKGGGQEWPFSKWLVKV